MNIKLRCLTLASSILLILPSAAEATDVKALLDDTGGKVLDGKPDGGGCWLCLWDLDLDEFEMREDGRRKTDLVQWEEENVIYFEASFDIWGQPHLTGSISVNAEDHIVLRWEETDEAGYMFIIDGNDVLTASTCLCTTSGGANCPGGTACTNANCDDVISCKQAGSCYCNWRERDVAKCG